MAARNGISDDWEHLSDDSYSVISAPTSDGEDEAVDESVHFDADVAADSSPRRESRTASPPVSTARRSAEVQTAVTAPPATALPSIVPDQHPFGPEPRDGPADTALDGPPDPFNIADYEYESDAVDELVDTHTNTDPAFYLKVLNSLAGILAETAQSERDPLALGGRSHRVADVCSPLSRQVQELTPIVSRYARLWSVAARDIPLDPNLHGWMSGVRVKLLGLQAEMQDPSRVEEYCAALDAFRKQMDDFLPIMRVDFNEFQAAHMSFAAPPPRPASPPVPTATAPIPIRTPAHRRPSHPSGPPPDMWRLRRELYRLKDEVQRTIEQLTEAASRLPPGGGPLVALAADVARSYRGVLSSLALALSNHASDWIEHDLCGGGLTHAEFARLDVEAVRDLTAGLEAVWEQEGWEPRPGEGGGGRGVLAEGQLDRLEALAEVLTATLNPERD
ncbi:hypothetical protein NKR23_g10566 [Pleurostoma richardsiae]|uniref:Uncharacterized protein n=1 Tax=Pleurostoma richardsiae TaxID=41990 RepID=A0AA38R462_9PEZI|nr:hypothetical protein NKR23_g10566 [Pleurostoma richardsiae]